VLRRAVEKRRNVLVAGGTSTGKTTLVNALLAEVAKTTDRFQASLRGTFSTASVKPGCVGVGAAQVSARPTLRG
jgi:putative ribosome biogenesis GTPase RsgA